MDTLEKKNDDTAGPVPHGGNDQNAGQTTAEVLLTKDGLKVHPQPVEGDPLDPLNWSFTQKHIILAIVMAL